MVRQSLHWTIREAPASMCAERIESEGGGSYSGKIRDSADTCWISFPGKYKDGSDLSPEVLVNSEDGQ